MNRTEQKREPTSPYECWCMPCIECIYYNADDKLCEHPDALPHNELTIEQTQ